MPIESSPPAADAVPPPGNPSESEVGLRLRIRGAVQGVGFRPLRLPPGARARRSPAGCATIRTASRIEVEGPRGRLESFVARLARSSRRRRRSGGRASLDRPVGGHPASRSRRARHGREVAVVLPDLATCAECRGELFVPADRRFAIRSPTAPTAARASPSSTTCRTTAPCDDDARLRALPGLPRRVREPRRPPLPRPAVRLPRVRPATTLDRPAGNARRARGGARGRREGARGRGGIVALKGIGGYQLLVRRAVRRPPSLACGVRKHRPAKPLALMVRDVGTAREFCRISAEEAALLARRRRRSSSCSAASCPRSPGAGARAGKSPPRSDAADEPAAPLAARRGRLPAGGNERQPRRRADRHRRPRGSRSPRAQSPTSFSSTTGRSPAMSTTASPGSPTARRNCCAGPVATRRCRCSPGASCLAWSPRERIRRRPPR